MLGLNLYIKSLLAAVVAISLLGCGSGNEKAPAVNSSGKHPAAWVVGHRASYHSNAGQCKECHGNDFKGGITKIDCFNQSAALQCHADGHGPRNVTHALPFTDPALHGQEAGKDLIMCQECHGQPGGAGSNPNFNLPIGFLATGCEASSCHKTGAAHPVPWSTHQTAGNLINACALCHGATLTGGAGPKCSKCHTALAAGTVPSTGTCVSCHTVPPSGSIAPNIAGAHLKHNNLLGVTGVCNSCHSGAGSGTAKHPNEAVDVAFLAAYNAKSGTASFNAADQTCTNVSCHGGQPTTHWQTGVINVTASCTSCHASGTSQFNSYFSGQHSLHITGAGLPCSDCHDLDKLAEKHFAGLDTPQFEQPPAATIRADLQYSNGSCSPQNSGTNFSISVCHFTNPQSW